MTRYNHSIDNAKIWMSVTFFAIVVTLTGMIAANTPLYDDDLVFANAWGCAKHLICPDEDFNPFTYAMEHRMLTNGRVGDMFSPLLTMVPRWCYGTLYAACFGVILLQMMRLARMSFRLTPVKCVWMSALAILFFPWIDLMYTRAVFLNYFPAIIFSLVALRLFIRTDSVRGWKLAGYVVACVLCGCWHELMPVVLFPSAVVYCILTGRITRNQWIVTASMAVGVLVVVTAPSFFNRPEQLGQLLFTGNRILLSYMYTALLVFIAIASLVSLRLRKDLTDKKRSYALVWALVLPILPSCAIMLASLYESRMILFAMVLALSALFYSLPRGLRLPRPANRAMAAVTTLLATVVVWQLAFVAVNSIKVRKASEEIIAQAAANPSSHIYYDLRDILANDILWLYKTQGRGYVNKLHTWEEFSDYTGYRYSFNILPPALKDFDLSKAEPVGTEKGVYYYDTYLIADAPCDSTDYPYGTLEASFDGGDVRSYRFMGTYFTDVNGKPLIYILPYQPQTPRTKPTAAKLADYKLSRRIMR